MVTGLSHVSAQVEEPQGTRFCLYCNWVKPLHAFPVSKAYTAANATKPARGSICSTCVALMSTATPRYVALR